MQFDGKFEFTFHTYILIVCKLPVVKVSAKNWSSFTSLMKKTKKVHAVTGRKPYLDRKIHPMRDIKFIVQMSVIVSIYCYCSCEVVIKLNL